jgi:hypothetical protein
LTTMERNVRGENPEDGLLIVADIDTAPEHRGPRGPYVVKRATLMRQAKCLPHQAQHGLQLIHDGVMRDPEHAKAKTLKVSISAGVRRGALSVIPAVHLDNELSGRSKEVSDVPAHQSLPAKGHSQP